MRRRGEETGLSAVILIAGMNTSTLNPSESSAVHHGNESSPAVSHSFSPAGSLSLAPALFILYQQINILLQSCRWLSSLIRA